MRILLVNARGADLAFGGAERTVDLLRDGLTARGHDVRVLAAYPARADVSPRRVTRHRDDPQHDPARRIADHLAAWRAPLPGDLADAMAGTDVLHTHNLPGLGSGVWELARRHGIPVVHTIHDYGLLCARHSLRRRDGTPCTRHPLGCRLRTRRLTRWAGGVDTVIGVSGHVLARHAGVFDAGVPTAVLPPPPPPVAGPPTAPPRELRRLGYLGALTHEKGVGELLAAAPALAAAGISLSLAGAGPLAPLARATPGVRAPGHLRGPERAAFLAAHDAGVVPSVWEEPAVPFAAQEWRAAGRPLIVSRRGALAELAGRPGVLAYDGEDPAALAAAVREAADPIRFARLAAAPASSDGAAVRGGWLAAHETIYAGLITPGAER